MHAPWLIITVSLAGVLAACSKPQPRADEDLDRALSLALGAADRPVVSQVELGDAAQPDPRTASTPVRTVARIVRSPRPAVFQPEPESRPAEAETTAPEETVAAAPTPEPEVTAAAAPQPEAAPEVESTHRGHRGGTAPGTNAPGRTDEIPYPGEVIFRIPGINGPVLIRGGRGSGRDPCVEHGTRGRGGIGAGVPIDARMPGPGGIGGSRSGGGRFGGGF